MNRQELEYLTRKHGMTLLIVLSLVAFLVPLFIRLLYGAPITPIAESYTYLRYASLDNITYDTLRDMPLAPSPYVFLLAGMQLFGVPWLLPLLLFGVLLIMLYYYLARFIEARAVITFALIAVVLSPTMSVMATSHNPALLALVLLVSALLLFERHPVWACILVGLAMMTASFIGLLAVLFLAIVFLRQKKDHELIGLFLVTCVAIVWYLLWVGSVPGIQFPAFSPMLFELGNSAGISVFFIIIAGYAMVMRFAKAPSLILSTVVLLIATFFIPALLPFTTVLLSLQIGYTIVMLIADRWSLELLQQSVVLLIACIGLFLLIATVRDRADDSPDATLSHTLIKLGNEHRPGAVLSGPSYAPLIEYFSGKRATLHDATNLDKAFYSRNPGMVYPFLIQTGTSYILITDDIKQRRFTGSDQGILFLLENSGHFVKLEDTEGNEVWYFIR
jgi:hypothetical protein